MQSITCLVIHHDDKITGNALFIKSYIIAILELYYHKRSTCLMLSFCLCVQMQMYGRNWGVHGTREQHQISVYQGTEKCHAQTGNEVICRHQLIEVCKCYHTQQRRCQHSYLSLFVALFENIINMNHQSYISFFL